jgi:PHP family Zn ribbon phosphoesterase
VTANRRINSINQSANQSANQGTNQSTNQGGNQGNTNRGGNRSGFRPSSSRTQPRLQSQPGKQWYRMDLHLHTPASADYQQPEYTFLDILRRAEARGLDIIAFTDHNTVRGYERMMAEIEQLEMLVRLDRAMPEERRRLAEYRRLLEKILVLPGFEFTATFGFHILGVFSPETRVRQIEHILLSLNIPPAALDEGNSIVGASSDVLNAYKVINEAGGIVIAAHVNTANGVLMRGYDFGGQTRIAYTQDPHLHALEVTDLERRGRNTARFFDGTKQGYPRRMICVQGSDAHRVTKDPRNDKYLGVGDRATEVQLNARTFEALKDMFTSNDFARVRPFRGFGQEVFDHVHAAREVGPNIVQAFYESVDSRSGRLYAALADVCAFSNTNGGTIYVGASPDITVPVVGVSNPGDVIHTLKDEIALRIVPPLEVAVDTLETGGKLIVRVQVPQGGDVPYALDENRIYIRMEADTNLAVRDEIVRLIARGSGITTTPEAPPVPVLVDPAPSESPDVAPTVEAAVAQATGQGQTADKSAEKTGSRRRRGRGKGTQNAPTSAPEQSILDTAQIVDGSPAEIELVPDEPAPIVAVKPIEQPLPAPVIQAPPPSPLNAAMALAPRTGVEVVGTETRKGEQYHMMRDLRNGNIVKNVTRLSARRLWHYAIMERENNPVDSGNVQWSGDFGLWKRYRRGGVIRYDLVLRENGIMRVFYGVTDDGMHGAWAQFVSDEAPEIVEDEPEEQQAE